MDGDGDMNILKFALIGGLLLLAGCETTSSIPYEVSTGNIMKMRANVELGNTVRVEEFDIANGVDQNPMCRLMGPVKVSPGKTMMQFVKEAFEKELYEAGLLDIKSPVVIKGRLEKIEFSSVSPASWDLSLRLQSSNGSTLTVTNNYRFATSFSAYGACKNVADAFGPAVQILLGVAIENPDFPSLFARNDSVTYTSKADELVIEQSLQNSQVTAGFNLTGLYRLGVTGNLKRYISSEDSNARLVQSGNKVTGTFGDGGKIWGEVDGTTVKFDWYLKGNSGTGKLSFDPENNEVMGKYFQTFLGDGKWNLTKLE